MQTYRILHGLVVASFQDDTPLPPLTTRQLNLLLNVKESGGLSIKDLADKLGVTTSSVSTMVERLVEAGVLTREPNPDDRRGVIVRLSHGIEESLEPFERQTLKMLMELLEQMGDESARQLRKLHTQIRTIAAAFASHPVDGANGKA